MIKTIGPINLGSSVVILEGKRRLNFVHRSHGNQRVGLSVRYRRRVYYIFFWRKRR